MGERCELCTAGDRGCAVPPVTSAVAGNGRRGFGGASHTVCRCSWTRLALCWQVHQGWHSARYSSKRTKSSSHAELTAKWIHTSPTTQLSFPRREICYRLCTRDPASGNGHGRSSHARGGHGGKIARGGCKLSGAAPVSAAAWRSRRRSARGPLAYPPPTPELRVPCFSLPSFS